MSWQRLGRMIAQERNRRRQTQAAFAQAAGLGPRTIADLEAGQRERYEDSTVILLELAMGWDAGSVRSVVQGGKPKPVADPEMARVRAAWPRLTAKEKRLIAALCEMAAEPTAEDR